MLDADFCASVSAACSRASMTHKFWLLASHPLQLPKWRHDMDYRRKEELGPPRSWPRTSSTVLAQTRS
jgi:hypothetical protein